MTTYLAGPASTAKHDATEQRDGARALLISPILTAGRHPEQLALVRRHARALKLMFATTAGYQLVVESSFARLHKGPLDACTPARPALRVGGNHFAPRTYAYLALLCAGLLAAPSREQVLISVLVEQVRIDAGLAGLNLDDTPSGARHLVHAILYLIELGVLTETDGTVAAWRDRREEALLDVHRPLLPHLLTHSLTDLTGPEPLLDGSAQPTFGPDQPRRSLRRKLMENPLVRRGDLSDAERDVLSRERTELSRVLDELFGLTLEVRLEGALTYDSEDELTDVKFPGEGTVARVALLLVGALVDDLSATTAGDATPAGHSTGEVLAPWDLVRANVDLLIEQYGNSFGSAYVADPGALQSAAVALLESVSAVRVADAGLLLHPVCARYRPEPVRTPPPTRPQPPKPPQSFMSTLFSATAFDDYVAVDDLDDDDEPTTDLETS